jgi:hypothetical protein
MNKKYELFDYNEETKLFRIKALRDFGNVKVGDIGGWIESEHNLSHEGDCWVSGNAQVSEDARVFGDARVSGNFEASGDASVGGDDDLTEGRIC